MRFDILTLFPEIFQGYLGQSLLNRAIQAALVDVRLHNIRDWSKGKHNTVDDRPFGGGPGMVMKVEPVVQCVEAVRAMDEELTRKADIVFVASDTLLHKKLLLNPNQVNPLKRCLLLHKLEPCHRLARFQLSQFPMLGLT